MDTNTTLTYRMQKAVGKSVIDKLIASGMSDIYIGEKVGVSRTSVYTWRTKENPKIRLQNLKPLAELLDVNIDFSGEKIEFTGKLEIDNELKLNESINLESDMTTLNAEDIIKDLRTDKNDLRDRISLLNKENQALNATIKAMDINVKDLHDKLDACTHNSLTMPVLELDKCQNVVDLRAGTFVDVSPKFAEKLGYSVFELVGQKWEIVIPYKDRTQWGLEVAGKFTEDAPTPHATPIITDYDVRFLTKDDKILVSACKTKTLSNIISMNEITFLD